MIARDYVSDLNAEAVKWEWRVFWAAESPLHAKFSDFSAIEGEKPDEVAAEKNTDTYVLIPGRNANIKLRDGAVSCKILSSKAGRFAGYHKKQTYVFPLTHEAAAFLTGVSVEEDVSSGKEFVSTVFLHYPDAKIITAEKERKIARFRKAKKNKDGFKKMKAEFSCLKIGGRKFWTFCLESKDRKWLESTIEKMDIGDGRVMDYTEFLSSLRLGKI